MNMHKFILLSLLLIFSTISWAQEGLFVGGYATLEALDVDFVDLIFPGTQGGDFEALYGWGLGARTQYMITNELSLKIGLAYMQRNYRGSFFADTSPLSSFFDPSPREQKIHLISVPIQVGYAIVNHETFKLSPAVGINAGIEVGETDPFSPQGGSNPDQGVALIIGFTEPSIAGLVSIGLEYHLSSMMFVTLEPYFQHVIYAEEKETLFRNMNRYGAMLSVNVKLR